MIQKKTNRLIKFKISPLEVSSTHRSFDKISAPNRLPVVAVEVLEAIALREHSNHEHQHALKVVQPFLVLSRMSVRFRGTKFPSEIFNKNFFK